ncbi:MAG TPA: hypothetical protein VIY48_01750 [Candidatus Paceibacterota bacterium]
MSEIRFVNTTTRTQVSKYYTVEGAPALDGGKISPSTALFVFEDGDFKDLVVHGKLIKLDGSISDRSIKVASIYSWDQGNWPDWLKKLRDIAFYEFATGKAVDDEKMTYEDAVSIANG